MAIVNVPAHSSVATQDEGNDYNGAVRAGDDGMRAASAIRFQLPSDFFLVETTEAASLRLYCRSVNVADSHRIRIGVPASSSQVLPSDLSTTMGLTLGSYTRTLGNGSYSPPLDYFLTGTNAFVDIDVLDMLVEARVAGRLSSGYILFVVRPDPFVSAYMYADGAMQTNPPELVLDYFSFSPPPGGGIGINRGRINRGLINRGLLNKGSIR